MDLERDEYTARLREGLMSNEDTFLYANLDEDLKRNLVRPQYTQHSSEWDQVRTKLATASTLADILAYPHSKEKQTIYQDYLDQFRELPKSFKHHSNIGYSGHKETWIKKHFLPWTGGEACWWGTRFEPISAALYEHIKKTKLVNLGLLVHEELPWIGASPDGMTQEGELVEFKNPYMRRVRDDGWVSLIYWIQAQWQHAVCNTHKPLQFCQVEMQLYENQAAYREDHHVDLTEQFKGSFVQLGNEKCVYPPSTIAWNSEDMITWCEGETEKATQQWNLLTEAERHQRKQPSAPKQVYWKSIRIRITPIARSHKWFDGVIKEAKFNFQTLMDPTFYPKVQGEIDALYARETTPLSYSKPTIKLRNMENSNILPRSISSTTKAVIPRGIGLKMVAANSTKRSDASTTLSSEVSQTAVKKPYRPNLLASSSTSSRPFGLGLSHLPIKRK